jgi:oligopeptide/dipeptide ABC transporter ATP-binding protein
MPDVRDMSARDSTGQSLLEVRDLSTEFRIGREVTKAVRGVSFTVTQGEILGLVGETGSGKSTVAKSVLRLIQPPGTITGGSVRYEQREMLGLPEPELRKLRGRRIAYVPQNPFAALHPLISVERQFIAVIRAHERMPMAGCRAVAAETLEHVGIRDVNRVLRSYAHQLSGGMAQRVVLGLAIALKPSLLIADEPTTSLDVTTQRHVLDMVRDLLRTERMAMLLVTHDLGIVAQYCARVLVMYSGKVVEASDVDSMLRQPAHPYSRLLLEAAARHTTTQGSHHPSDVALIQQPGGCAFMTRCTLASEKCSAEEPELRRLSAAREVRCHNTMEGA